MLGTFLGDMLAQATQGLVSTQRSSNSSRTAKSSSSSSSGGFELDLARTARLVGFSALVGTPVAFVWFSLLDQVCACGTCVWVCGLAPARGPCLGHQPQPPP
jgi:hypothetical protein